MVEIFDRTDEHHFVRGEIAAFRSPIDGTIIDSRTKYDDHCARHNVVPYDAMKGQGMNRDRYENEKHDRALREHLWEMIDRTVQTGRPR